MAYQLVWSAEAEEDLKKIILYLKETWSPETAERFVAQTYRRLEKLTKIPTIGRGTTKESIYMYKLDNKNAIFFH